MTSFDAHGRGAEERTASGDARRRAFRLVALMAVVGAAVILVVQHGLLPRLVAHVERLDQTDPARGLGLLKLLWYGAFGGMSLLLLGAAGWLWSAARAVAAEDRFPPSRMRTFGSAPVRRGPAARRRGRWLATYGALLACAAVGLLVLAHLLMEGLLTG